MAMASKPINKAIEQRLQNMGVGYNTVNKGPLQTPVQQPISLMPGAPPKPDTSSPRVQAAQKRIDLMNQQRKV